MPAGTTVYRGYDGVRGYNDANPGYGDTRFQPFDARDGHRVPAMYIAQTDTAALLETVFHEVHHLAARQIGQSTLLGRVLAYLRVPQDLHMVDLRDPELARLGVARSELVATSAEHYPCTRRVAAALYERSVGATTPQGLIWHSRQAELAGGPSAEVAVVYTDRVPSGGRAFELARPGLRALYEGTGRERADEIAEELDAVVVLD